MIDLETARLKCLSYPQTTEHDHFGKPAYRVNKKIFATLWLREKRAVLKLSIEHQAEYCDRHSNAFFPVHGAWGKKGWTAVELQLLSPQLFSHALTNAWLQVAGKKLVDKYCATYFEK